MRSRHHRHLHLDFVVDCQRRRSECGKSLVPKRHVAWRVYLVRLVKQKEALLLLEWAVDIVQTAVAWQRNLHPRETIIV